jgi:Skp family chaperone for outer membrane proteins
MPKDLKQKFTGVFADLERETKNYQNLLNSGFKGKKDVTGLEASGKRINALMKTLETSMKGIRTEDLERSFRVDPASIQKLNKELADTQAKLQTITSSSDF